MYLVKNIEDSKILLTTHFYINNQLIFLYNFNIFYLYYLIYLNKLFLSINYMNNIMIILLSHHLPLRMMG